MMGFIKKLRAMFRGMFRQQHARVRLALLAEELREMRSEYSDVLSQSDRDRLFAAIAHVENVRARWSEESAE